MTYLEFFGCSMIAFGPVLSMFITSIATDPIRIIILISAAFFWLLSLLVTSFIWFFISFAGKYLILGIVFSILIQETFRYLLYKLIRNAERGLQKVSEIGNKPSTVMNTNRSVLSYVCGLGFGVMSGAFSLFNLLADSIGPGTLGINKNDSNYFFISSSFLTLAFILLHVFWGIIFFKGCDQKNYKLVLYVILSHLIASQITLLNEIYPYIVPISLIYLLVGISCLIALKISGCSMNTVKSALNH